jgi:transcription initiation factor TFIIA large subunit
MNQIPIPTGGSTDESRRYYNEKLAAQMRSQQARLAGQRPPLSSGQTDGASDWAALVAERRAISNDASTTAEMTLRQRLEQMSLEMEGGGLMLPASQRRTHRLPLSKNKFQYPGQFDGPDSDDERARDEDDEDAINSDLDDPDDDAIGETEDDANTGELMLCTYDKVQRVKNKWKCTLKDGVLTTGGKE